MKTNYVFIYVLFVYKHLIIKFVDVISIFRVYQVEYS